jgi:hypothetical protein
MLTNQQNFAVVQTELDRIFYQKFQWDTSFPSLATAETAALFKPMQIDRAAYIEEIFMGSPLYGATGEVQTVPATTPKAGNKLTTYVVDYTQAKDISKDWFDDKINRMLSSFIAPLKAMSFAY